MNCRSQDLPLPLHGLPTFSAAEAALLNRLHRRLQPWQGHWRELPLQLHWAPAPSSQPMLETEALWGRAPLRLALPGALFSSMAAGFGEGPAGALWLEAALLPLLEALEGASGQAIQLQPLGQPFTPFAHLRLSLNWGDDAGLPLELSLSQAAAVQLAALLDPHPAAPAPFASLPLPALVSAGEAPLALAELRSLREGDVVMLDGNGELSLHCAGRQARLRREQDRLHLLHPLTPRTLPTMSDTPAAATPDATLDSLELTLTCQVGRLDLTLGQLRELGEGSLLALEARSDDAVELMVNGRRVGHGQLVRIGDGLGVRVLSFASL
ncbi:type III secretion system cytoplasmic ring protein SctQ [Pseudomonas sp. NPDC007930]|uniref:type III secretion system cytoplasmic ring protein SctQ n=1 Tax=Pseudomonas sp. NPDC007930 TaxID=3364417 RepID=UPI0036E23C05